MSRRTLFLVGAVVLAAAVLAITLWVGPHGSATKPPSSMGPLPPMVGGGTGGFRQVANQTGSNWYVDALDKHGQLTQIWGRTLSPLPRGQSLINGPVLRVHLAHGQVLEIRAGRATFDAPNNILRRGDFQHNVVLTLFEAPEGQTPDLRIASPDARLRVFLDEARFDMEIGQIDAAGPVHATAPTLDFTGEDLSLSYNEGREQAGPHMRINRLTVARGKELRVGRQVAARTGPGAGPAGGRTADTATSAPGAAAASAPAATQGKPVDYYRATLVDDVTVHSSENDLAGQTLLILFSGQQETLGQLAGPQAATAPADPTSTAAATQPANPLNDTSIAQSLFHASDSDLVARWSGPLKIEPVGQKPAELAGPADRLLVLTGQPARIERVRPPTTGAAQPARHEVITAASASYLLSSDLIDLQGSAQIPVDVDSQRSGHLHGQHVVLNQRAGTGKVVGPGTLVARGQTLGDFSVMTPTGVDQAGPAAALANTPAPLGAGANPGASPGADVNIAWSDGVDLKFVPKPVRSSVASASQPVPVIADVGDGLGLGQLTNAIFQGNVTFKHPQMDLAGQKVELAFEEPDRTAPSTSAPAPGLAAAPRQPGLKSLHVTGQGEMHGRNADPRRNLDLTAPEFTIEFVRNSLNKTEPRHLLAQGPVQATQPGQKITASRLLDVAFYNPRLAGPATTQPVDPRHPRPELDVRSLLAEGDVHMDQEVAKGPEVHSRQVAADIVRFDGWTGIAELTGVEGKPASIVEPAGTLVGGHIRLSKSGETAEVIGPGALHLVRTAKAPAPGAPGVAVAAAPPLKPGFLDALWQERMFFNNRTGQAQFFGQVKSSALDGLATYEVTGKKELTIHFLPDSEKPPQPEAGLAVAPATDDMMNAAGLLSGPRHITSAKVDGDATFQTETWADQPNGKLETRLHLGGPAINFDNLAATPSQEARQMVWIDGPGKALFEDYRPEPPGPAGPAGTSMIPIGASGGGGSGGGRDVTPLSPSGRGKTLFTWTGGLDLNLLTSHMLMTQKVQMVHEPTGSKDTLQLDTQQLSTQLTSAGAPGPAPGLQGWISGHNSAPATPGTKTPQPSVQSIHADGSVRASWTQVMIDADHMAYDGPAQLMIFSPDPGKRVEVTELDKGTTQPMQRLIWRLAGHRIEFEAPGPSHAPLIPQKAK